ncbi:diaminopropionate ammonia-lyase [Novosphingobium naphthalenivorans]|uniref:diaminopropionate ammonia-lyase n=1 Tax=Novosphingobium naphthalenivorans TaxID=273168 RepID=UPI0008360A2C|nr:diaminopropionate ammonia-lyase [Novosphingobium naphthalenivorans]
MAALFSREALESSSGGGQPGPIDYAIPAPLRAKAVSVIPQWPGYHPTPLISLPGMAKELGVGSILTKYEAGRFGLGSFKALGGAFAVANALEGVTPEAARQTTVVTASDGNHGLSVAWGARQHGCTCKIYLHEHVSEDRAELIRQQGAEVVRIAGTYDDSTHQALEDARTHGWILLSDTAIAEDDEAPGAVMAGYTVMMQEILADLDCCETIPSHVFVQGGCGGLAAAVFGVLFEKWGNVPRYVMVEPDKADCLFQSARAGRPVRIEGDLDTVMGGLSVGEVSLTAWETIVRTVGDFLTIPDAAAIQMMKALGQGRFGDAPLLAGDAGVAGLAGLSVAAGDPRIRETLGLTAGSIVLTIVTEGAVDRSGYARLTGLDPQHVAEARA